MYDMACTPLAVGGVAFRDTLAMLRYGVARVRVTQRTGNISCSKHRPAAYVGHAHLAKGLIPEYP
jgi:hypothetical protein